MPGAAPDKLLLLRQQVLLYSQGYCAFSATLLAEEEPAVGSKPSARQCASSCPHDCMRGHNGTFAPSVCLLQHLTSDKWAAASLCRLQTVQRPDVQVTGSWTQSSGTALALCRHSVGVSVQTAMLSGGPPPTTAKQVVQDALSTLQCSTFPPQTRYDLMKLQHDPWHNT